MLIAHHGRTPPARLKGVGVGVVPADEEEAEGGLSLLAFFEQLAPAEAGSELSRPKVIRC
jgi:hypothetical protein